MKPIHMMLLAMSLQVSLIGAVKESSPDGYFVDEVWGKVGELSCLKCHNSSGEAEDSRFILRETILLEGTDLQAAHDANFKVFAKMARMRKAGQLPRLLLKPVGELDHEGEEVLEPKSTGYRILEGFVRRMEGKDVAEAPKVKYTPPSFFDGVTMLDDRRLLRRLTLSISSDTDPRVCASANAPASPWDVESGGASANRVRTAA